MWSKLFLSFAILALLALPAAPALAEASPEAEAPPVGDEVSGQGLWVYTVKFVCGFNPLNGEQSPIGLAPLGEGPTKLGNYATEINIFNPSMIDGSVANIRKKLAVLSYKGDVRGREPEQVRAEFVDGISLESCSATLDDCNLFYRFFLGTVPTTPPPPMIGYWVLYSDRQIDVDAVYTAEVCSDWVQPPTTGGRFMCANPDSNFGAGISIDVERVEGRFVVD